MSDELGLPEVPEAKPDDIEDVSWALSTAEAMWARGDHLEGIKWVRRAAEAASEAEDDLRALELAKAAADLTGLLNRKNSRASIDLEEVEPMSEDPAAAPPPVPSARPKTDKPAVPRSGPASVTKQVNTPSRPPAPLPSQSTSQPPRGKPLGTNSGRGSQRPSARVSERPPPSRRRRSRENLDELARQALGEGRSQELPWNPAETAESAGLRDPTAVSHIDDLPPRPAGARGERGKSAMEWDASPTQNLTGDLPTLGSSPSVDDGDRKTAIAMPVSSRPADRPATNPPATVAASHLPLPPVPATDQDLRGDRLSDVEPRPAFARTLEHPHVQRNATSLADPAIQTSQAVRVVVWRDGAGVHVAPAGTVVSAITVDAVLVALEPNADLTAWLSPKNR